MINLVNKIAYSVPFHLIIEGTAPIAKPLQLRYNIDLKEPSINEKISQRSVVICTKQKLHKHIIRQPKHGLLKKDLHLSQRSITIFYVKNYCNYTSNHFYKPFIQNYMKN